MRSTLSNIDEEGLLLIAGTHDSYLERLEYVRGSKLIFHLASENKKLVVLEFSGIEFLNIESLWEGLIVGYIHSWPVRSVPNFPSSMGMGWHLVFSKNKTSDIKKSIDFTINKNPDLYLVNIICTYGGNIGFVCEDLAVTS